MSNKSLVDGILGWLLAMALCPVILLMYYPLAGYLIGIMISAVVLGGFFQAIRNGGE